jgi:hypothetical protein
MKCCIEEQKLKNKITRKESSEKGMCGALGGESLSLSLSIFHGRFLLTPGFIPENMELSAPPP